MASKTAVAGSKRTRDPSAQEIKVKFLINIPLKVDVQDEAQKRCRYLLDALSYDLSNGNDKKSGKDVLEDVAVIFGMNGKHSSQLVNDLKQLETFKYDCKIKHDVITYTWGSGGTIAQNATKPPYQDIREHLKNSASTKKLVEELRANDQSCLVYFSFVDSDTLCFNSIYSQYLQIVREELSKDSIPPTVMSTGYEFHRGSEHHIASWLDRMVRVAVAEVDPLLVYYPEPNFCVLVRDKFNTIEESFINRRRNNMESAVLISSVKARANFKAVFSDREPIIIDIPARFKLSGEGLKTGQSALDGMNLAKGTFCNMTLTNDQTYTKEGLTNDSKKEKGIAGKKRGYIIELFNSKTDEEFEKSREKNLLGKDATILVNAIREAREYRKFVYELNEKLPKDK